PLLPTGPYHASKAAATMAAVGFAAERSVRLQVARPFHVFGEGEAPNRFWPSMKRAAFENRDFAMTLGDQVRDFLAVALLADVLLRECHSESGVPGRATIRDLGSGNPCTLRDFAQFWWQKWTAPGNLLLGAAPYRTNEV